MSHAFMGLPAMGIFAILTVVAGAGTATALADTLVSVNARSASGAPRSKKRPNMEETSPPAQVCSPRVTIPPNRLVHVRDTLRWPSSHKLFTRAAVIG